MRNLSDDSDRLEGSYGQWLSHAERQLAELRSRGCRVEKVDVDLDELLKWCTLKRLPLEGESRAQYVAEKLRQG